MIEGRRTGMSLCTSSLMSQLDASRVTISTIFLRICSSGATSSEASAAFRQVRASSRPRAGGRGTRIREAQGGQEGGGLTSLANLRGLSIGRALDLVLPLLGEACKSERRVGSTKHPRYGQVATACCERRSGACRGKRNEKLRHAHR